jgi:hypothetical protein
MRTRRGEIVVMKNKQHKPALTDPARPGGAAEPATQALLTELVAHLRQNRTQLREE